MIVIPMVGLSSRFFRAGYDVPKYMLEARGKTLFEHSVSSFSKYYDKEKFVFVIRDVFGTYDFVYQKCNKLGILDFEIVVLDEVTRGQAETVYMAVKSFKGKEGMLVFNIDTFRPGFQFPKAAYNSDGYLEVFKGQGSNWSFARLAEGSLDIVIETAEKRPISNLCSTGLYYFSDVSDFIYAFEEYLSQPQSTWEKGELYIAPLYNNLIKAGRHIVSNTISRDEVVFCGVPEEYEDFLREEL